MKIYQPHPGFTGKFQKGDIYIAGDVIIDVCGNVTIGDGSVISNHVHIYTHKHSVPPKDKRIRVEWKKPGGIQASDLTIEEDVWIADYVIILQSCNRIGKGAIVGAGSVVTKDIPSYEIWAGNPAKKVGERP